MKVTSTLRLFFAAVLTCAAALSLAQIQFGFGGWANCIDPGNTTPFSTDFGITGVGDSLIQCTMGVSGTVTYGTTGTTAPHVPVCWVQNDNVTATAAGRIGFGAGSTGSVQSNFDDFMAFTYGFPYPGDCWGYATLVEDGTRTLFGSSGFVTVFNGASDRYYFAEEVIGNVNIQLRCDVIGDAARLQWTLTNNDTANTHKLGLWFGQWPAMIVSSGATSGFGGELPPLHGGTDKPSYIVLPGQTPPSTEHRLIRAQSAATFPPYVDFCFGQSNAYGLRVDNGPTVSTEDAQGLNSDATNVAEFALGSAFFLLGGHKGGNQTFPDVMFGPNNTGGDVYILDQPGFIQKYDQVGVASGSSTQVVSYYHSTWSVANFAKPYSVVLDAPNLISTDSSTTSGLSIPSAGYYTIRVYIDNTRGFSTVGTQLELDNVNVSITLPAGLSLAGGDSATKVIPKILPAATTLDFVDFHVVPDGVVFGQLPYSVTVSPTPGPTKTVSGVINVAGTPKLTVNQGPNFVSTPFNFTDSSWESILGLQSPTDFTAFNWDPSQNGYVTATSAARGKATWIVANNAIGVRALQSSPTQPADLSTGARSIELSSGWNAIANPYNYAVPLGQIVGSSDANPTQSFSWSDLVNQGFVNGGVAYFDSTSGSYKYLQSLSDLLQPNTGYWIYVNTAQKLTLAYPPVYTEFLPGSSRSTSQTAWNQTANQWRLQLVARDSKGIDDKNYVGAVPTSKLQTALQVMKPPASPAKTGIELSVEGSISGKATRLAQALSVGNARATYTVDVKTKEDGNVTLTWPNISQIPGNVQVQITDKATGVTRVLNKVSGYQFQATANSTRQFTLQVQPGTAQRALISNVLITRPSRDRNAAFSINYSLTAAATTSIRILSASNSEVYTISSGRAENGGNSSVTWNLRDNANRNVAPGAYRVEIVAESTDGTRQRAFAILNVTR
jgi:hypothetical protein